MPAGGWQPHRGSQSLLPEYQVYPAVHGAWWQKQGLQRTQGQALLSLLMADIVAWPATLVATVMFLDWLHQLQKLHAIPCVVASVTVVGHLSQLNKCDCSVRCRVLQVPQYLLSDMTARYP